MDKRINEILSILSEENTKDNDVVTLLIELSDLYDAKGNASEAFKYAAMSTIVTFSPRADACCCLGGRYMVAGNYTWALKWFNNALNNISDCDKKYYTWLPILHIAQVHLLNLNFDEAYRYLNAADVLSPDNEYVKSFKLAIDEAAKNFSEKK